MSTISRREMLGMAAGGLLAASLGRFALGQSQPGKRTNVLLIVADDMNCDAVGAFGSKVAGVTPNIDRLASEGMRFEHGHVTVGVCQPSRSVLMTGRYPHRNGAEGFQPIHDGFPTLQEKLNAAGYLNGILGKVKHLEPRNRFMWDMVFDQPELGQGRDPQLYYQHSKEFFDRAAKENKPFFLMANSHDPHRPFSGSEVEKRMFADSLDRIPKPSKTYSPGEVTVPGFLPDIPDVRTEVAQYYSSARRCDDTVGAILKALKDAGQEDSTLVMFISDNGMAFPFSKANCYLHSTHTPWIVRYPDKVKAGSVDRDHFISGIDFMPTILEAAGIAPVSGVDGKSFLPLLSGQDQAGRGRVFTVFHKTNAGKSFPMRCVQDQHFGYIYNAWADGKTEYHNESEGGLTMKAMRGAAETSPEVAARVKMFHYRVPEEFYDFEHDPDAMHNLIDDPKCARQVQQSRQLILGWMQATGDPLIVSFQKQLAGASGAK